MRKLLLEFGKPDRNNDTEITEHLEFGLKAIFGVL